MIINVLFEHDQNGSPHGCSHIRLLRPLGHPSLQDKIRLIATTQLSDEKADVVIVERWWKPGLTEAEAQQLVRMIKERGSTLIYTLDDNLLDVGLDEEGSPIPEEILRATYHFIREANGVIVSTPALKNRLQDLNPNIRVIPNALDERLFLDSSDQDVDRDVDRDANRNVRADTGSKGSPIVLGYMGTLTHAVDLAMVVEPLRKILRQFDERVRLEIIGVSQDSQKLQALFGDHVRVLDTGDAVHYEQFPRWFRRAARWDIGLAPLTDRHFNRYKSDIKFLDYGVHGIPAIFSNVGPYPASVIHEQNGILVDNEPDAWFDGVSRLIDDVPFRQKLAANAREYVRTNRLLKSCAVEWHDSIRSLCIQT